MGSTDKAIANTLMIPYYKVQSLRKKNKLKPNRDYSESMPVASHLSKTEVDYRLKLASEGLSLNQICELLGLRKGSLKTWYKKRGIDFRGD